MSLFRTLQTPWMEAASPKSDTGSLLPQGLVPTRLRDVLDVGAFEDQLVLLRLRLVYRYTLQHLHVPYDLHKMVSELWHAD